MHLKGFVSSDLKHCAKVSLSRIETLRKKFLFLFQVCCESFSDIVMAAGLCQ